MKIILAIYDYFQKHRLLCFSLLAVLVISLVSLVFRIDYKEDITDFLPVDEDYHQSMRIYQEIAAADKIVLFFSLQDTAETDKDKILRGIDKFTTLITEKDTCNWIKGFDEKVDYSLITDIFDFVYYNLPYFLRTEDYARIDSVLNKEELIKERLEWVKEQIASPASSLIEPMLVYDPLGMGADLADVLRNFQPEMKYKQYNGYIFTEDEKQCLVTIKSPFGGSETDQNSKLIGLLNSIKEEISADGINLSMVGAPVIAVDNAKQIKHDTIIAVIISVVLILALLLITFKNLKSLILISITTAFGFLFALGIISLFRDSISLIVIGIASIIIGISVNYPLHYVCHLQEHDYRTSLKDLVTPLIIGNITTVGAFLTLVTLEAIAIRDLGLFSALMLIGTIIFVLIFLPQINIGKSSVRISEENQTNPLFASISELLLKKRLTLFFILAITLVLVYFSLGTEFDSNMNHINFMTVEQKTGMAKLASMRGEADGTVVYVTSSSESYDLSAMGLEQIQDIIKKEFSSGNILNIKDPSRLLPSVAKQEKNIEQWKSFWNTHSLDKFKQLSIESGFTENAFEPFFERVEETNFDLLSWEDFNLIANSIFTGFIGSESIIAQLVVKSDKADEIEKEIASVKNTPSKVHAFDLTSLNSRIADTLSDDFNYIGFACSLIVFVFLWISFGRLELAIIAFLPMVFGWIWILGLMKIFDISFNIVNIILATFIFGQGDDYTIFVTEGIVKDFKEGGKVLLSYQKSIILSALIMLIGIGSLIIAKHPAMHSLATVTIIGMFVVVFMAWTLPPIVFNLFIKYDKSFAKYLNNKKGSQE